MTTKLVYAAMAAALLAPLPAKAADLVGPSYYAPRAYHAYHAPVIRKRIIHERVVVERPLVIERRRIVERPVVVERPIVVERPVFVERPVVVKRRVVVERPVPYGPPPYEFYDDDDEYPPDEPF